MPFRLAQLKDRFKHSIYFLPLAILVAAFMMFISESAYRDAHDELRDLVRMGSARLQIMHISQRVTDAETSQRGYLITGRAEYLGPYQNAASDVRASLEKLRDTYTALGHVDAERVRAKLDEDVQEKLSELADVLIEIERGNRERALQIIYSGLGRAQMERIREDARELMGMQNARIELGMRRVFDTLLFNRVGVSLLTAMSLLILAMFLRQSRQIERTRVEQAQAIKAERDQLEVEVRRRTARLTELARHLQTAREDERARLARDLHDELGATLTAAKLDVARLRPKLPADAPELLERLAHLNETLNAGIALKRRIIEDLRPSTLSNLGLVPALEILCRESGERLDATITAQLEPVALSASAQLTVFRLVQETLTNIGKHAQARAIRIQLEEQGAEAVVSISDDGVGFDITQVSATRHGLSGMRFRVEAESGTLEICSTPGQGTRIQARLPLRAASPEAAAPV
ncbi:MAG: CHASE3 domain-containing protein [Candidatus Dactylopiibacterium sp.]|nr:CHASE3 domain-containing protein [Candidatus Dactylopiibacterium sp.]